MTGSKIIKCVVTTVVTAIAATVLLAGGIAGGNWYKHKDTSLNLKGLLNPANIVRKDVPKSQTMLKKDSE